MKPLDLMRWLVRLVTSPGGLVLDPFAGSGTTGEACLLEGFRSILIERECDYIPLIEQRVRKYDNPHAMAAARRGEKVATRTKPRKAAAVDEGDDLFADWAS